MNIFDSIHWRLIGLVGLILVGFTLWSKRSGPAPPPLRAELAALLCPPGRSEHAVGVFAKTNILFLCLDKELASKPELLRCDTERTPMLCEDTGSFYLTRNGAGQVFGTSNYNVNKSKGGDATAGDTEIQVDFGPTPLEKTGDAVETAAYFTLPDAQAFVPPGFTYLRSTECNKWGTHFSFMKCGFEMKSASLYWRVNVRIAKTRGTPMTADEYRQELAFFMKYLPMLVSGPSLQNKDA